MARTVFDDDGYLGVKVAHGIVEDAMANVAAYGLATHYLWARGGGPMISPYWEGITKNPQVSDIIVMRVPAINALVEANKTLAKLGLEVLIFEGFRPKKFQRFGWAYNFWFPFGGEPKSRSKRDQIVRSFTVAEIIAKGRHASKAWLVAEIENDKKFVRALTILRRSRRWNQVRYAAKKFGMPVQEVAQEYLKFIGNLRVERFTLAMVNKPHGTGGSADLLLKRVDGDPVYMGSPPDDVNQGGEKLSKIGKLNFFENRGNFCAFVEAVKNNWAAREYFRSFYGDVEPTMLHFVEARHNRRKLYWAMRSVGATAYNEKGLYGEWWHWNFGNWFGGNQAEQFPGAGGGCQSFLAGIRDTGGELVAVWSAEVAHEQAAVIIGQEYVY